MTSLLPLAFALGAIVPAVGWLVSQRWHRETERKANEKFRELGELTAGVQDERDQLKLQLREEQLRRVAARDFLVSRGIAWPIVEVHRVANGGLRAIVGCGCTKHAKESAEAVAQRALGDARRERAE
jgi:hypothetical protein